MTDEIKTCQTAQETTNAVHSCRQGHTLGTHSSAERTTPRFNRYLYENLVSNVGSQIEYWAQKAGRESLMETRESVKYHPQSPGHQSSLRCGPKRFCRYLQ